MFRNVTLFCAAIFIALIHTAFCQSWNPIKRNEKDETIIWDSTDSYNADLSYRAFQEASGGKEWTPKDRDYYFSLKITTNIKQKKKESCGAQVKVENDIGDDLIKYFTGNTTPSTSTIITINGEVELSLDLDDRKPVIKGPLIVAGFGVDAETKKPGNGCFIDPFKKELYSPFLRYSGGRDAHQDSYRVTLSPKRVESSNSATIKSLTRAASSAIAIFSLTPIAGKSDAISKELSNYEVEMNKARSFTSNAEQIDFTVTSFSRRGGEGKRFHVLGAQAAGYLNFSVYRRASHILNKITSSSITPDQVLDAEISFKDGRSAIRTKLKELVPAFKVEPVFPTKPTDVMTIYNACQAVRDFATVTNALSTVDALLIRSAIVRRYSLAQILTPDYIKQAELVLREKGPGYDGKHLTELCLLEDDRQRLDKVLDIMKMHWAT